MNKITLDVLIPSYRMSERHLLRMLDVRKPDHMEIKFIIAVDNPDAFISAQLEKRLQRKDVLVIHNTQNIGAPMTRNVCLDASNAEWVLFWDDDIEPDENILFEYEYAMQTNKHAPGFCGPTLTPNPHNSFTRGIQNSDILTFWHLPAEYKTVSWGITANLLIRRSAVGKKRFSSRFPKLGGGEDIDFCLRIVDEFGTRFSIAWMAKVRHDWWNDGKRSYVRFMRWAYGDSVLPLLFPQYRYYNFPNMVEFLFLGGTLSVGISAAGGQKDVLFVAVCVGALLGEVLGEWGKLFLVKNIRSPVIAVESSLVRCSNDLGRFVAHVRRFRLTGITERFDYFCDGLHVRFERKVAAAKFALFLTFTMLQLLIFTHL